jgi:flagella basal body P-ring formation protein FlgA
MKRLLLLLSLMAWLAPCSAAELELRADALVRGRQLTLGQVAALPAGAAQRLGQAALGPAPRPGYPEILSRQRIERLLRQQGIAEALQWRGAQRVRVESAGRLLDGAAIGAAALAAVHARLAGAGLAAEVALERQPDAVALPEGEPGLSVQAPPLESLLRPRAGVRVELSSDGLYAATVPVALRVRAEGEVLVARRGLARGALLRCEELQAERRDLAALGRMPAPAACREGQRLLEAVPAGAALAAAALQPAPAVMQGEEVALQVPGRGLRVEARAVALADGQLGQTVAVRALRGSAPVAARVTAAGVVQLMRSDL